MVDVYTEKKSPEFGGFGFLTGKTGGFLCDYKLVCLKFKV